MTDCANRVREMFDQGTRKDYIELTVPKRKRIDRYVEYFYPTIETVPAIPERPLERRDERIVVVKPLIPRRMEGMAGELEMSYLQTVENIYGCHMSRPRLLRTEGEEA